MIFYPKNMNNRNIDIDFFRGIAIILMSIYHWYAIKYLRTGDKAVQKPLIDSFGHISRTIFIFLMGLSMNLSYQKKKKGFIGRQITRSCYLTFYAILITVVTKIVLPDKYVRFGILHYMAFAMSILALLAEYPQVMMLFGITMYITYVYIHDQPSSNIFKNILGYKAEFQTIDMFPISKWILISCLGYFIGDEFVDYKNLNNNQYISNNILTNSVAKIGQYSLEIYIIHWFIIYGSQTYILDM